MLWACGVGPLPGVAWCQALPDAGPRNAERECRRITERESERVRKGESEREREEGRLKEREMYRLMSIDKKDEGVSFFPSLCFSLLHV